MIKLIHTLLHLLLVLLTTTSSNNDNNNNNNNQVLLYQLDGRKMGPIQRGYIATNTTSSNDTNTTNNNTNNLIDPLLYSASQVVQMYMLRDPDEIRFTILALAPNNNNNNNNDE